MVVVGAGNVVVTVVVVVVGGIDVVVVVGVGVSTVTVLGAVGDLVVHAATTVANANAEKSVLRIQVWVRTSSQYWQPA